MKNIDARLIRLNQEINRREKLKIHLIHLDEMIQTKGVEKDALAEVLAKEEDDLAAYENLTLFSLFSKILGTHEQQLEIERQEYLHALMSFRGVEEVYNSLIQERDFLIKSLKGLHAVEKEFDLLVKKKDKLLQGAEGYPIEMVVLNARIASYTTQVEEINLAITKGREAKKHLHQIVFNLSQLKKWGLEGRVSSSSSMVKKTRAVQNDIYAVNKYLLAYEDQLFSISTQFDMNFQKQIKKLEAFLDRFLDDLITDWVVNNKIKNSAHMVTSMVDAMTMIEEVLEHEKKKIKQFMEEDIDMKGHLILDLIQRNKS